MEKFRGKSHRGEIYPLFPKVFVEYFVRDRKAANRLQFIVSEKTQAVLEYPGVSWKVTKSKFYVFSVGNILLLLCMSSHLLMCIYLKI